MVIKNVTRVGVARTSLLRTFSCPLTDSATGEDSSLAVKRDKTVQVKASPGSRSEIRLFIRKHFVMYPPRARFLNPGRGREQVPGHPLFLSEGRVAIEQFRKKGKCLHVENETKINSATSQLSVPLWSRTIGPYAASWTVPGSIPFALKIFSTSLLLYPCIRSNANEFRPYLIPHITWLLLRGLYCTELYCTLLATSTICCFTKS